VPVVESLPEGWDPFYHWSQWSARRPIFHYRTKVNGEFRVGPECGAEHRPGDGKNWNWHPAILTQGGAYAQLEHGARFLRECRRCALRMEENGVGRFSSVGDACSPTS